MSIHILALEEATNKYGFRLVCKQLSVLEQQPTGKPPAKLEHYRNKAVIMCCAEMKRDTQTMKSTSAGEPGTLVCGVACDFLERHEIRKTEELVTLQYMLLRSFPPFSFSFCVHRPDWAFAAGLLYSNFLPSSL